MTALNPDQDTTLSPGPKAATATACVVVVHGHGLGRRANLSDEPLLIGRTPDAGLQIAHLSVSRRHCEIHSVEGGYQVIDLGATNPTRVNERKISEATLSDGDYITVGESILKFIGQSSPEARYHENAYKLAAHDPMTSLCNRHHFVELAEKQIAASQPGDAVALCLFDIDRFMAINKQHDYSAGDVVLQQTSRLLRQVIAAGDIAARIGGDTFALLMTRPAIDDCVDLAESVVRSVADAHFQTGQGLLRATASAGLCPLSPECRQLSLMMRGAESALAQAKATGGNRLGSIGSPTT